MCAFQRLPCTGAPPRSWARVRHAAASPHRLKITNKISRPAPVSRACPLHDDVWRCVVSLLSPCLFSFVAALPSLARASSSCLQGWRMTFEPWAVVHFSVSTCRGDGQLRFSTSCLSVSQQSTSRLFCFQLLVFLFFFIFYFLLMGATIWLRLSPPFLLQLPPSLAFLFISALLSNCP